MLNRGEDVARGIKRIKEIMCRKAHNVKKISNFALSVACNNLECEKHPHSSNKSCRRAY